MDKYIKNNIIRNIVEMIIALIIALLVFFIIKNYCFRVVRVDGDSMYPTYEQGDLAFVCQVPYWFSDPDYNDIVVFPYEPNGEETKQMYIKRVVGKEGDVVDLVDHQFTLNGEPIDDEFSEEIVTSYGNVTFPVTVPEDCYFVLGDNRNSSKDSRYSEVGCVPDENIVGKTIFN